MRYGSTEKLDKVALIAKKLGYRIMCVEGLSKSLLLSDVLFIPRKTSSDINELLKIKRNTLKVYLINSPSDLKSYPRLRGVAALVCLSCKALNVLTPKHVGRLVALGLPIEVAIRDIYKALKERGYLRGLDHLISTVESGKVELIACSGASKHLELLHPKVIISTLIELGVDEVNALKAVTSAPAKVIRGLEYGAR